MVGDSSLCRLFVGTFLSPQQQELLGELKNENQRLAGDWGRRLRWVKQAKLHLTWVFLGSSDSAQIPEISGRLASLVAAYAQMAASYDRVEFWPSARKPRQFVITPSVVPSEVKALASEIRTQLGEFAEKPDYREFRPHLTLLRFDQNDQSAPASMADRRRLEIPTWLDLGSFLPLVHEIRSVSLIESHMGKGADEYERLGDFPLAGRCR